MRHRFFASGKLSLVRIVETKFTIIINNVFPVYLPTGNAWQVLEGQSEGQTQVDAGGDSANSTTTTTWAHPIDLHLATRGIQGWPKIVLEVWHRDALARCSILGYGLLDVPSQPGPKHLVCHTWRPLGTVVDKLATIFTGETLQLAEESLIYSARHRHNLTTESAGDVKIELNLIFKDFEKFGIETH